MSIRQAGWVLRLSFVAFASASALAQTQAEMDREACDEYKRADAELNRVYQQVVSEYRAEGLFVEKLRGAQRAWLVYRDAQLEVLYPARDPQRAYGDVHRMCRCQALTELTLERTEALRRWVAGVEAGDVCAGSVRIRDYTGASRRGGEPEGGARRARRAAGALSSKAGARH